MRQLDQLQASLDRVQTLSAQASGDGRCYFEYPRANGDIRAMKQGISQYLAAPAGRGCGQRAVPPGAPVNSAQRTAFIAGSGGLNPADIKHLVVALFFALLFLLAVWMIRTVYVGWSNQDVKAGAAGMFVVRLIILLELAMLFYSY